MTPNHITITTPSSERELTDNELQAVQGGMFSLSSLLSQRHRPPRRLW
jgi:bacteriocin-like protein